MSESKGWLAPPDSIANPTMRPHAKLKRMGRRALKAYIRELEQIITDAQVPSPPASPIDLPEISIQRGGIQYRPTVDDLRQGNAG